MDKIFTGNYGNCVAGNLISISGDRGKSIGFRGKSIPDLAPKRKFWNVWHSNIGKIPEEENTRYYIEEYYNEILSKVNIEDLLRDEKEPILLCYEQPHKFCHRHILAEYINIVYGIEVKEIAIDQNLKITEKQRPKNVRKILEEVIRKV